MSRRRGSITVLGAMAVLAMLAWACGGSADDGASGFEGTTVRSDDGVLTVEVPEGAAAEGVEVTITRLSEDDLPLELQGADPDAVVIVGYELGPDGAEFSEPVEVTFRLDPGDLGLDLPDDAVPLGLVLTENSVGELARVENAVLSREAGDVVVQMSLTHFSPAIVTLQHHVMISLWPSEIALRVGEASTLSVRFNSRLFDPRDLLVGVSITFRDEGSDSSDGWLAQDPFSLSDTSDDRGLSASITCTAPTEGLLPDAYGVRVRVELEQGLHDVDSVFGRFRFISNVELSGDGECSGEAVVGTVASGLALDGWPSAWHWKATKARDEVMPTNAIQPVAAGTQIERVMPLTENCSDDECQWTALHDIWPFTPLEELEAAPWAPTGGGSWMLETRAYLLSADYGGGDRCVLEQVDTWTVIITTDGDGALGFEGSLRRAEQLDQNRSAQAIRKDLCPEYAAVTIWDVVGIAGQ